MPMEYNIELFKLLDANPSLKEQKAGSRPVILVLYAGMALCVSIQKSYILSLPRPYS